MSIPILKPGDVLLYAPSGVFGHLIAIKTWTKISHVETYLGNNESAASRDGIGVDTYPLRIADLAYVLRPKREPNLAAGLRWHEPTRGQKYDWKGLLVFTLAVKQGAKDRMFCSEHTTRLQRAMGITPFAKQWDADRVAPANFLMSPVYHWVWIKS